MEIKKLYTLSQFVDLVSKIELDDDADFSQAAFFTTSNLSLIYKYNDLLKQPLNKEMFVNPYERPSIEKVCTVVFMEEPKKYSIQFEKYSSLFKQWEEAEKKVIFNGFKERKWDGGTVYDNDELDIFIDLSEHKTLHDLAEATNGELELKNINL